MRLRVHQWWRLSAIKVHIRLDRLDKKEKGVPHNWFEGDRNWKPHHRQRQHNNAFVNVKTTVKTGLFNQWTTKRKRKGQNYFEDDSNWKPHHTQRQYNNTFVNGIVLGIFDLGIFYGSAEFQGFSIRGFSIWGFSYTIAKTNNIHINSAIFEIINFPSNLLTIELYLRHFFCKVYFQFKTTVVFHGIILILAHKFG